ncbi:hypothetical protein [Compostimonas suwonensis]|uniref:ABC transporter ATP-binding protein n=1 Tax=Compostimonas suwonensis TaxID=1048394 RepID=A0A2M9C4J9_9MICO|nr:hypothetical protein [Compostimonas suwonensis]PJJ65460.1 hypothetical protein CLV54_0493 [Compostimonas suwonensis]
MKITVNGAAKGPKSAALPLTTLSYGSGTATLVRAETERRPTVLGLVASGRMRPDTGTVLVDGEHDPGLIRRAIALVDAPEVSEPAGDVTVAGVVAEELMFAGKPSHPLAVSRKLAELGYARFARTSIGDVEPAVRIRLLTELAVLRPGVEGLVITAPDRHGGDPMAWWTIANDLAARGFAVLVVAGEASAAAIGASAMIERMQQTDEQSRPREHAEPAEPADQPEPTGQPDPAGQPEPADQPAPADQPDPAESTGAHEA